jgi:hypothetical protein
MRRDHVRRARPLFQTIDYSLAELIAFVQANRTCAYCGCVLTAGTFSLDHANPISRKADICAAVGRSEVWFRKWWGRYLESGPEGFYDLTRANPHVAQRIPPE